MSNSSSSSKPSGVDVRPQFQGYWSPNWGRDLSAGVFVFFIALPLSLGIALASGAPLFSGLVTAVVGGIMVGALSGSQLGVAGPAAGMSLIVLAGIQGLGFNGFLGAVCFAGIIQVLLGWLKFGRLGGFFPSSVIQGLMVSIGLVILAKQIPHGLGYDSTAPHVQHTKVFDSENLLLEIINAFHHIHPGALIIFVLGLLALVFIDQQKKKLASKAKWISLIPAPLIIVVLAVLLNQLFGAVAPALHLSLEPGQNHLVYIPDWRTSSLNELFALPSFEQANTQLFYFTAITVAMVGSVETLASLEATEKLDPYKRIAPLNRELVVQGSANIVVSLIGGLPMTSVIARTSANIAAGAISRFSAISHGIYLLLAIILIPYIINLIPLAVLASLLVYVAFRLTHPMIYLRVYQKGINQFIPFVATIVAVFFSNLLAGLIIGLFVGLIFTIIASYRNSVIVTHTQNNYLVRFTKDVSFLNKALLRDALNAIPPSTYVIIDGTQSDFIDQDIIETISDFQHTAPLRSIQVELKKSASSSNAFFKL